MKCSVFVTLSVVSFNITVSSLRTSHEKVKMVHNNGRKKSVTETKRQMAPYRVSNALNIKQDRVELCPLLTLI